MLPAAPPRLSIMKELAGSFGRHDWPMIRADRVDRPAGRERHDDADLPVREILGARPENSERQGKRRNGDYQLREIPPVMLLFYASSALRLSTSSRAAALTRLILWRQLEIVDDLDEALDLRPETCAELFPVNYPPPALRDRLQCRASTRFGRIQRIACVTVEFHHDIPSAAEAGTSHSPSSSWK